MIRPVVRWAGDGLVAAMGELTPQQARGVVRIVQAELEGRTIADLLDCEGQICASTTFYRKGGWKDNPRFQRALELARRDYRTWMLEHGTSEALTVLADTATPAARALRQRVVGDGPALAVLEMTLREAGDPTLRASAAQRLGATGLPGVVAPLRAALENEANGAVREAIVEALGLVAGGAGRDVETAEAVLDRADIKTASKGLRALTGGDGEGPVELGVVGVVATLEDEELGQLLENLETAGPSTGPSAGSGRAQGDPSTGPSAGSG